MSHREFLSYSELTEEPTRNDMSIDLATDLAKKSGMKGPTHYYTVLCHKNPEALKTLLCTKKLDWSANQYTGLNIRYDTDHQFLIFILVGAIKKGLFFHEI